jgi:AcrR family transcriptional regulator
MVQQKKAAVREAILEGAFQLFSRHGYAATTLAAIAKSADVSQGNVYIYFGSKLEILYAIYDPWLRDRIDRLESELDAIRSPRNRLKRLLEALWRDIPAEENGFLNNIMQAITLTDPQDGYRSTLVQWLEQRIEGIVMQALPFARRKRLARARIAHVIIMAFDGFAIHRHLHPDENPVGDASIAAVASMLLRRCAGRLTGAMRGAPGRGHPCPSVDVVEQPPPAGASAQVDRAEPQVVAHAQGRKHHPGFGHQHHAGEHAEVEPAAVMSSPIRRSRRGLRATCRRASSSAWSCRRRWRRAARWSAPLRRAATDRSDLRETVTGGQVVDFEYRFGTRLDRFCAWFLRPVGGCGGSKSGHPAVPR